MSKNKYIIAIGGTGMRCLESFVHLCAIGMFDCEEINILALDTDNNNGNKRRVIDLINLYNKVKSDEDKTDGGNANVNTFFSAKINLYEFCTNYSKDNDINYDKLALGSTTDSKIEEENKELSELFLDKNVQTFNLANGYRAQTHLGSMLMYHGIIDAARKVKNGDKTVGDSEHNLQKFITLLANDGPDAIVFVFGSVFGGTGASSIPIIPVAMRDAAGIFCEKTLDLDKVKFGATLLTEYFTFNAPDKTQKNKSGESVIADANNFSINSQAALQFYKDDPTVKACYKRLYHIGWPLKNTDFSENQVSQEVITGGDKQKNGCHVVELLCACAAYDFFNNDYDNKEAIYVFRTVKSDGEKLLFDGDDFLGKGKGKILLNKLGAFLSFAHIALSWQKGALKNQNGVKNFNDYLKNNGTDDYTTITDKQFKEIGDYLKDFAYDLDTNHSKFIRGWIYQVFNSFSGTFFFKPDAFTENLKKLEDENLPGDIFVDDKLNWEKTRSGLSIYKYGTETFLKILKSDDSKPSSDQSNSIRTTKEAFLARIYNAITICQNKTKK